MTHRRGVPQPARLRAVVVLALLAAAPAAAQSPVINARAETRTAARGLAGEVQAVVERGTPAWVGWRVPIVARANPRLQVTGWRANCRLEPPTELVVLARVEAKAIVEIRAVSVDCDVDAAGMALVWLQGVDPGESVAWLATVIGDGVNGRRRTALIDPALAALGLHAAPAAARALSTLARDGQTSHLRGQALIYLAQHASAQAGPVIADAIERDPELEVKRRAVIALGQLPRDEGIPLLINVARTHRSTDVRRQAMLTLGQTNDPRALEFFEQVLLR